MFHPLLYIHIPICETKYKAFIYKTMVLVYHIMEIACTVQNDDKFVSSSRQGHRILNGLNGHDR